MLCKKCRKEIPDGSIYCNYCGKKQETTKRKTRRRARGTGTIRYKPEYKNRPYVVFSPRTTSGTGEKYIGCFKTAAEAQAALDSYFNSTHIDHSSLTLAQAYENWSSEHFESLTKSPETSVCRKWSVGMRLKVRYRNIYFRRFIPIYHRPF